jgi:hypothetical protein
MNFLHIHPYCDIELVTDFVKNNFENIDCIRMDTSILTGEMRRLGYFGSTDSKYDSTNELLVIRKIVSRVFNNHFFKQNGSLHSPMFMTELTDTLSIDIEEASFLFYAFHYSIPIFINDSSIANMMFCGELDNDLPLISNECDWTVYRDLLHNNVDHYVLIDDIGFGWDNLSWFFVNISFGYPTYSKISPDELLPPSDSPLGYLYDEIIKGKYGRR